MIMQILYNHLGPSRSFFPIGYPHQVVVVIIIIIIIAVIIVNIANIIANHHHIITNESREPWCTAMAFQIAVRSKIVPRFNVPCDCCSLGGLLRSTT